jgi:HSP20 family protein
MIRRITGWPRWESRSPFDELERIGRQMDRLKEGLAGGLFREPSAGVFPLVNVTEDDDRYYVRAELPGVATGDLDISVTGKGLSISGERNILPPEEGAKYHRREREGGKFSRILDLPSQIETSKVEAQSVDGILTVVLPKSEAAKPKQITVKGS